MRRWWIGAALEQLGQRAVLGVAEVVVSHQPLDDDPAVEKPVEGASGERRHRGGSLVVVDLGVDQSREQSSTIEWANSQPTRRERRLRSPVSACPGASKRPSFLVSMCSRLPGPGHS
jgi:hypothetical protein